MKIIASSTIPTYNIFATGKSVVEAITLGNLALTRHPSDTGAFFMSVIPSMAGCAGHLNRWSVPDSDCDNPSRPASILLSPDVGGLQFQSGVSL